MRFPRSGTLFLFALALFAQQPSELTGDYFEDRSNRVWGGY